MVILVTGVAGALGLHVAGALLRRGEAVLGVDDPRCRGDPGLRGARLAQLRAFPSFSTATLNPTAGDFLDRLAVQPRAVLHLAEPPREPARRIAAQLDLLEQCRARQPDLAQLVQVLPVDGAGDARLAGCEEVIGRGFARSSGVAQTALRVAEVYGLWGEPGGTLFRFADALAAGRPVALAGTMRSRHPLWLDDAAGGILAALDRPPVGTESYRRLDLAGVDPASPERLLTLLEAAAGRSVDRGLPAPDHASDAGEPPFDVASTHAAVGWWPVTPLEEGVARFAAWYLTRHQPA